MKNKGFTLVELLAVIVILAIITAISSAGVSVVKDAINKSMWNSNIKLIERSAINYGEDNKNRLKNECIIGNEKKYNCLEVSVQYLINKHYIKTKETDGNNEKVLINKTINKVENENENYLNGYYVNQKKVLIYIEDNLVYAKYME